MPRHYDPDYPHRKTLCCRLNPAIMAWLADHRERTGQGYGQTIENALTLLQQYEVQQQGRPPPPMGRTTKPLASTTPKAPATTKEAALPVTATHEGGRPPRQPVLLSKAETGGLNLCHKDEQELDDRLWDTFGATGKAAHLFLRQLANATPDQDSVHEMNGVLGMCAGFEPTSPVEGMLASQAALTHGWAMDYLRRAKVDNAREWRLYYMGNATKLMTLFIKQTEAMAKLRGKGQQTVTVIHQHVQVNQGGQAAIAGTV